MGRWVYQDQIDETVGWFVRTAMPDAQPGWEELPWMVDQMGRTEDHGVWWTVSVDIPTSVEGYDCWLSFRVVEPGGEGLGPYVEHVSAVRSGRGEHDRTSTSGTTARACGSRHRTTMMMMRVTSDAECDV